MCPPPLLDRARELANGRQLAILGITGAPGSGKTTLAGTLTGELMAELGDDAVAHLPMDGFHLADVALRRLGRLQSKGAPGTFDAWGYAAMLHRIRHRSQGEVVYAPAFERDLEQPIAGSVEVPAQARLVVTEGNYLLLPAEPWRLARAQLDEVWFVDADDQLRRERLIARHVAFGKTPAQAQAWVRAVDEPNAQLVRASRPHADLVVSY